MTLEELLAKLEGVRHAGGGHTARCPSHEDKEASLSVGVGEDGFLLLNCFAGCDTADILDELGLTFRDLRPNAVNYAEPEAVYEYTDEEGVVLFQALRFPGKKFRQRHEGEEGWVWNLDGVRRVPYLLPQLIQGVKEGQTIYLCEGEKDVENLRHLGKVATCNPMGAGKWKDEYNQFFAGAKVIIIADRDEPGRKHAETVKDSLQGVVQNLWVVQAKTGKDVSDHLAAGHGIEELEFVKPSRIRRGIITARQMAEQGFEDLELQEHEMPGYVLVKEVPLVFRPGRMYAVGAYTGDGKTCFALQGFRTLAEEGRRVGYFSLEMPERDLRNRLVAHKGVPLSLTENPWNLKSNPGLVDAYRGALDDMKNWNVDIIFDSMVTAEKVSEIARDREYEAVFIDHVHRFGWGAERRKLEDQVNKLTNMALEQNLMLVILCQLRRFQRGVDAPAYPMPTLQDFRETEMIGQDASMALSIWRQRDEAGRTYTGQTQVQVLKNRHTTGSRDAVGGIFMPRFDRDKQMFTPQLEVVHSNHA